MHLCFLESLFNQECNLFIFYLQLHCQTRLFSSLTPNTAFGKFDICLYILSAVPAVLIEALPVTRKSIENELSASQSLAWKYTAVLEKLTDPDSLPGECDVPTVLLKQALYNIRQHEVFLKILLVRKRQLVNV